ncbi:MAG TPA: circularly permuted type 2 ATP-grasp protein [Polyangia bacterium]|nr:circularly permuted type 2 ATP-grasp protein [Polyangia bacterium]
MPETSAPERSAESERAQSLARDLEARLSAPGAIDASGFEAFLAAQRRLGLTHGDRPLCRHLRPIIISAARYREMAGAAELIVAALAAVAARSRVDPALAAELGLSPVEQTLAAIEPGYPQPLAVGRLDMLADATGFHVLELNADSPAGITDQPLIQRALGELPHLRVRHATRSPALAAWAPGAGAPRPDVALLAALREIFTDWSAGRALTTIAIVDWCGVDTAGELQSVAEQLNAAGHRAVCVDPDQLSYTRGRLWAEVADGAGGAWGRLRSMPVDLVYRRIITSELLARRGLGHPLIRAYRDGAVCVANSFRTKALNKKAAFAVLTDPRYADLFTDEQRRAIAAHVPWTRRVRPEMVAELGARREELVLKPNDEYGGKGVWLGWCTPPAEWAAAVSAAAATDGAAVVQERRYPSTVRLPTYRDQIVYEDVYFDICPFLFAGRAEGAMVRVSATQVSNVSAGGGIAGLLIAGDSDGATRDSAGEASLV